MHLFTTKGFLHSEKARQRVCLALRLHPTGITRN